MTLLQKGDEVPLTDERLAFCREVCAKLSAAYTEANKIEDRRRQHERFAHVNRAAADLVATFEASKVPFRYTFSQNRPVCSFLRSS